MLVDERVKGLSKFGWLGWGTVTILAVSSGLMALRYALPHVPFPATLDNFSVRHSWLIAHATFSAVALLTGPWQFLLGFRNHSPGIHRWLGRVYIGAVLAGWVASLPIAAHAQTGLIASSGFLLLGVLWIATTAAGYFAIRHRQIQAHRDWMIRSYALTAAAITLRLYLPALLAMRVPFLTTYPLIA